MPFDCRRVRHARFIVAASALGSPLDQISIYFASVQPQTVFVALFPTWVLRALDKAWRRCSRTVISDGGRDLSCLFLFTTPHLLPTTISVRFSFLTGKVFRPHLSGPSSRAGLVFFPINALTIMQRSG